MSKMRKEAATIARPTVDRAEGLAKSRGAKLLSTEDGAKLKELLDKINMKFEAKKAKDSEGVEFAELITTRFFVVVSRV